MTDALSTPGPVSSQARLAAAESSLAEAQRAARARPDEAADRFQTLLATMLVREMRRSLPEGFFGTGPGADTFDSWMDEHLGRALAEQDALGLAGMIKASLAALGRRTDGPSPDSQTDADPLDPIPPSEPSP